MPRPNPKRARAVTVTRGHVLSDDARSQLIDLLNSTDPLAIGQIQLALGTFLDGREHLDNIPRAADYVSEFKKVRRDADKVRTTVAGWTDYYRDQFAIREVDIHLIENALKQLIDTASCVISDFEGQSSRGAPSKLALGETVGRLHLVFKRFYQGPETPRTSRGAVVAKSDVEERELEFIKVALRDANIVPKFLSERQVPHHLSLAIKKCSDETE